MFVYNPTNTAREVYGFGGGPVYENLVTTIDAESWGMIQFPKSSVAALNGLEFALGKPGQNFKDLTGWKFSKILAASDAGVAYLPNLVYGATVNPLKTTLASLPAVADYSFDSLGTTFETINSLYASYNALSAGAKSLFTADEVAKING